MTHFKLLYKLSLILNNTFLEAGSVVYFVITHTMFLSIHAILQMHRYLPLYPRVLYLGLCFSCFTLMTYHALYLFKFAFNLTSVFSTMYFHTQ